MSIQVAPAVHIGRCLQALIKNSRDVGAMLDAVVNNLDEHSQSVIVKLLAFVFFNDLIGWLGTLRHIHERLANLSGVGCHFCQTWASIPFEKWLRTAARK